MAEKVKLVPYESDMGPNFVPYEVIEARLEAVTRAAQPKQDTAEVPAQVQPE